MKNTIAKNFKLLRTQLKFTQKEMAEYLKTGSRESISQYENAEREIPLEYLERCSDLFSIDLIDFFEENETIGKTNFHFAFRANEISNSDLESITQFKKIISNYKRLERILNEKN